MSMSSRKPSLPLPAFNSSSPARPAEMKTEAPSRSTSSNSQRPRQTKPATSSAKQASGEGIPMKTFSRGSSWKRTSSPLSAPQSIPGAFEERKTEVDPAEVLRSSASSQLTVRGKGKDVERETGEMELEAEMDEFSPSKESFSIPPSTKNSSPLQLEWTSMPSPGSPARLSSAQSLRSRMSSRSDGSTSSTGSIVGRILRRQADIPEPYRDSPIGRIIGRFLGDGGKGVSLSSQLMAFLASPLANEDVEQYTREVATPNPQEGGPSSFLKTVFVVKAPIRSAALALVDTVDNLLVDLAEASARPQEIFVVDEGGLILEILSNADSVLTVRGAYIKLQGRLHKAHRHIRRYLSELLDNPENSPALSALSVQFMHPVAHRSEDLLRLMMLRSNGQDTLNAEQRKAIKDGASLEDVLPEGDGYWSTRHGFPERPSEKADESRIEEELLADSREATPPVISSIPDTIQDRSRERSKPKNVAFKDVSASPPPLAHEALLNERKKAAPRKSGILDGLANMSV